MSERPAAAIPGLQVVAIDTPSLGDRSYLVADGGVAVVVDPQRDLDRVLALADELGVRITHVAETHLHNDYVTGGFALARATGAGYLVPARAEVAFERLAVGDGDVVEVGHRLAVQVVATPGHTFHHVAYLLVVDGRRVGALTGGSLLYGSVGRTDLVAADRTRELTHAQYASVRKLAEMLPAEASVYPTHGFGSFCSATRAQVGGSTTIGGEARANPALTWDEERFVTELLAGLDDYPAYYAHMGELNASGPSAPDLTPPRPVDPSELRRRIDAGEWVVDLRARRAFAAGHLPGAVNFGMDGNLATYLGWLMPWGSPLILLGDSPEQVHDAQVELTRIGVDRPTGAATGSPAQWSGGGGLSTFATASFAELAVARREPDVVVLDVRRDREWEESHIKGAVHIPLHQLRGRIGEIPDGELWVHCAGGYRASIAASILDAAGRRVVAVDDEYQSSAVLVGPATTRGEDR